MNWKQVIVLIIVLLIIFGIAYTLNKDSKKTNNTPNNTGSNTGRGAVYCTQEVKECPDGSFVGRDPSRGCAYRRCP